MLTWTLLDTARIPGTGEDLRLMRRGDEYSIRLADGELMGSRVRGSEEALAKLGCARLGGRKGVRVLIGGLGMGFTLRATLASLTSDAAVVVAELVPAVAAWGRGPLAHLSGHALGDPRVSLHEGDVGDVIRSARATFDAILLDVDNGPDGLTRASNDRLYDSVGIAALRSALKAGGCVAVWSASPDPAFARRLEQAGFAVDEVPVRAHGKRGARHTIWVAVR